MGVIDAALKSARLALLSLLTAVSFISPWLGAIFSVAVIIVACFIAGWSFRLTVFGTIFAWDFLTWRRLHCEAQGLAHRAFTARRIDGAPIRTLGKFIKTSSSQFEFHYRPWLVLPKRVIKLDGDQIAIGNGFLYPIVLSEKDGKEKVLLNFPPRYCGHESELGREYAIPVRDVGIYRSAKAGWRWIKELASGKAAETSLDVKTAQVSST